MRQTTSITLDKIIAEQLKTLSKNKGVSQGVYIKNMIEFFVSNNIDYANGDVLLGSIVAKQIERVVKILRAFEKEYFKADNLTLKELRSSLLDVMSSAAEEIEAQKESKNMENNFKSEELKMEYVGLQKKAEDVVFKINNILNTAKTTKKGVEIEISNQTKEELDRVIKILMEDIYAYNVR